MCLLGGCGDKPASKAWEGGVLVLRGTPYEMGQQQGRALKDRILSLRTRWRAALGRATVGRDLDDTSEPLVKRLRGFIDLCVDQCAHRLPERLRQELDGLAAAVGLAPLDMLELEVLRDVLRMKGIDARLTGALAATRVGEGFEARAWWAGADALLLRDQLVVVRREPTHPEQTGSEVRADVDTGRITTALAWPGALGGLVIARDDGVAVMHAEVELQDGARQGFGGGLPFSILTRWAVEEGSRLRDVAGAVRGTTGHVVLSMRGVAGADEARDAVASMEAFVAQDEIPLFLGDHPFLAVGPYELLPGPRHEALQAAIAAAVTAGTPHPWDVVSTYADGEPSSASSKRVSSKSASPKSAGLKTAENGIGARLTWRDGRAEIEWSATSAE